MSGKKPRAVSNASASGAVLWGGAVAAGLEDVSGTDDTGMAGKVSPGLSPEEQKPLSGTARKLGSIVIHTHTLCIFGQLRSIQARSKQIC